MSETLHEELAWRLLEKMLVIRRFEEAVLQLSNENQFIGHYHLYIGQEATGSALISLLEPRDRLATTHRNHGHVLARGADPRPRDGGDPGACDRPLRRARRHHSSGRS